jgi:hypothetical protein
MEVLSKSPRSSVLELDGEIRYLRSTLIHGIREMPVRFTSEAA